MVIAKYRSMQKEKDISKIETLNKKSNSHNYKISKRFFDIIFSLIISPIVIIAITIISLYIKIKSPQNRVFFLQKRLGLNGKLFTVYKLNTMIPDAEKVLKEILKKDKKLREEYEKYKKLKNDPRVIKGIGTFLRKTSLDELPQFLNVFLGDMSVVGPRPYIKNEFKKYDNILVKRISSVKPGVTGLWQVTERNDTDFASRVKKDLEYISTQNFWMDIKIIFLTLKVMLRREGI